MFFAHGQVLVRLLYPIYSFDPQQSFWDQEIFAFEFKLLGRNKLELAYLKMQIIRPQTT